MMCGRFDRAELAWQLTGTQLEITLIPVKIKKTVTYEKHLHFNRPRNFLSFCLCR